MLTSLREKNTAALIGGVQKAMSEEGIELVDSTRLLKPLLAGEGTLTKRKPDRGRGNGYQIRSEDCFYSGDGRHRAKRGDQRKSLCGGGSDGGHGRDAPAGGATNEWAAAAVGKSFAGPGTLVVRCSGGWADDD